MKTAGELTQSLHLRVMSSETCMRGIVDVTPNPKSMEYVGIRIWSATDFFSLSMSIVVCRICITGRGSNRGRCTGRGNNTDIEKMKFDLKNKSRTMNRQPMDDV